MRIKRKENDSLNFEESCELNGKSDSLNFEESCELNGKRVIVLILKNHVN